MPIIAHHSRPKKINQENWSARKTIVLDNGFTSKRNNENVRVKKRSWEPFRICLLNSTAKFSPFSLKLGCETIVLFALLFFLLIIGGVYLENVLCIGKLLKLPVLIYILFFKD